MQRLTASGYGCWIGSTFCGALAYADDVVLLAPTVYAAEQQLKICGEYAREYDVLFNASKSKFIPLYHHRVPSHPLPPVHLMGDPIECVRQDKHLGMVIGSVSNDDVIGMAIRDFNKRVGMLRAHYRWLAPDCLYLLFKSFCMPLYGSVLWDFSHRSVDRFYTAWRKGIRLLLGLHPRTHCALLAPICNDHDVDIQLLSRSVKFLRSLSRSGNRAVQVCFALAMDGSRSSLSRSISAASALARQPRCTLIENRCNPSSLFPQNSAHDQKGGLVKDLLMFKSDLRFQASYNPQSRDLINDIEFIIMNVCTG